ncbi:hypothetical protein [Halonotius sp. GCM10025705]|uniref:hypothetical protein n=1 Tax=Halonotius sp. GCM10025705 TaxID=3252678 RepID=UPI0036126412
MYRPPHPSEIAGLLTEREAEEAKTAVRQLRGNDSERFAASRAAFDSDDHDGAD